MRARTIMSTTLFTVERKTPVRDVIRLLIDQRISGVPVVQDGMVVGIISEGDLILRERAYRQRGGMAFLAQQLFEDHEKLALEYRKAHGLVAEDVMSEPVITILPGTPVEEIAHLMAERHIKRVPVVEGGRLVGIVSRGDVLRAAYERLLALQVGRDEAPDELGEARPKPAAAWRARARRHDLPALVERRHLLVVGSRRRRRWSGVGRQRAVQRGERVVVERVGFASLALPALDLRMEGDPLQHQRPTNPSTGLLALACMRRGMRPAR